MRSRNSWDELNMNDSNITTRRLGDILELQRGYDLPTNKRIDGEVPIISSSGYSGCHNEYKCDGENVVTGRCGTIGEVYYHSGKCWPLNTALFVKDFKGNIPKYVYYLLKNTLSVYRVSGNDKSAVPGVDRKVIHEMLVPFHEDIRYQQNICDVLTCIDDKIDTNSQICLSLEAMAKTLYDYWFVQFDFPDENGKPYRASGGEMVWNEQLKQKVPKGWGVTTIGRIADNFDSQRVPLSQNQRENIQGTIPYYGATGIMDYINSYIFDGQYVLIAEDGSVMDDFGHPIVQMIWDKTWVNNHAHVLQGHDYYSNEILYFILKGIPVVKIMTGSIQKKINQDNLNNYLFPSIPQKILDQFHLFVKDVFEQIHQLELESKELTKLRDWLLPMLMNGQARVQ